MRRFFNWKCLVLAAFFAVACYSVGGSSSHDNSNSGNIIETVTQVTAETSSRRTNASNNGSTILLAGFYRVPPVGIDGWINLLEPEGVTPSAFPSIQECHLINGTFEHLLFFQELKIYDINNALVDSYVVSIHMPPLMAVGEWAVSKGHNLPNGVYEIVGEVGYLDPFLGTQILDDATAEFTVSN